MRDSVVSDHSVSILSIRARNGAITAIYFGVRASRSSSTRESPAVISHPDCATHPEWNVRMVSCVPGYPIDWAAMIPTGVPVTTRSLDARSIP